jgi:hypothetical protein
VTDFEGVALAVTHGTPCIYDLAEDDGTVSGKKAKTRGLLERRLADAGEAAAQFAPTKPSSSE